jgi:hypothetical protein
MRLFATGGTGHSGSYIIPDLIAAGHEATGLARRDTAAEAVSTLGARVRRGDLQDLEGLMEAAADSDGVIHVAHLELAGHSSAEGHRNADEVATLFADNAIFGNPASGDAHRGIEAIRNAYHSMWDGREQAVDLISLNVDGREAAAHVQVVFSDQRVDVIDVMTFDEDAKISSLRAYSGPANVVPLR